MIAHTEAYRSLKEEARATLNFVLLSCHAVPALSGYMKAVEGGEVGKLPDCDHFSRPAKIPELRAYKRAYKKTLGRFLLLSACAHFEAYANAVVGELSAFHARGKRDWSTVEFDKSRLKLGTNGAKHEESGNRLKRRFKSNRVQRLQEESRALHSKGVAFPVDLLSGFATKRLATAVSELRLSGVPELFLDAFLYEMLDEDLAEFHRYREMRNDIAHGKKAELDLKEAIAANRFYRDLALSIDQHLLRHFFVIDER